MVLLLDFMQIEICQVTSTNKYKVLNCQLINVTIRIIVKILNMLLLNFPSEIFFMQFATVAQVE